MEPRNPFAYHKPGPQAAKHLAELRAMFRHLHQYIEALPGGPSRERSLAITKLEESAMWAGKAVVYADPQSVPEAT
jgi:hypothetical protein